MLINFLSFIDTYYCCLNIPFPFLISHLSRTIIRIYGLFFYRDQVYAVILSLSTRIFKTIGFTVSRKVGGFFVIKEPVRLEMRFTLFSFFFHGIICSLNYCFRRKWIHCIRDLLREDLKKFSKTGSKLLVLDITSRL